MLSLNDHDFLHPRGDPWSPGSGQAEPKASSTRSELPVAVRFPELQDHSPELITCEPSLRESNSRSADSGSDEIGDECAPDACFDPGRVILESLPLISIVSG